MIHVKNESNKAKDDDMKIRYVYDKSEKAHANHDYNAAFLYMCDVCKTIVA